MSEEKSNACCSALECAVCLSKFYIINIIQYSTVDTKGNNLHRRTKHVTNSIKPCTSTHTLIFKGIEIQHQYHFDCCCIDFMSCIYVKFFCKYCFIFFLRFFVSILNGSPLSVAVVHIFKGHIESRKRKKEEAKEKPPAMSNSI